MTTSSSFGILEAVAFAFGLQNVAAMREAIQGRYVGAEEDDAEPFKDMMQRLITDWPGSLRITPRNRDLTRMLVNS